MLICGLTSQINGARDAIAELYDITSNQLQPGNSISYLNRTISWTADGIVWQGNNKYSKQLAEEWGMTDSKPVHHPHWDQNDREQQPTMTKTDATKFRRAAAVINYMSQDRPDLSVPANYLSRMMSEPKEGDETAVKRVIRYLLYQPELGLLYKWENSVPTRPTEHREAGQTSLNSMTMRTKRAEQAQIH